MKLYASEFQEAEIRARKGVQGECLNSENNVILAALQVFKTDKNYLIKTKIVYRRFNH